MAIYLVKKENETNERAIKRFKKQFQKARLLQELRGKRYFKKPKTKRQIRKAAIIREMHRARKTKEQFYA